jgi:hypothetical protein
MVYFLTSITAFSAFDDIFSDSSPTKDIGLQELNLTGSLDSSLEAFFDGETLSSENAASLNLSWETPYVSASLAFEFSVPIRDEERITSLSLATFVKGYRIEVGLLTKEWGSGDGVHVIDVPNALDYRWGITDDFLSQKIPEPMVSLSKSWGNTVLEILYKPNFTPMKTSQNGRWSLLPDNFANAEITFVETTSLSYSQFGSRIKTVLGPFDLGILYFNGFFSQPGYKNLVFDFSNPSQILVTSAEVVYTRYQLFAAEGTLVLGPITFLFEGGYYLSEDTQGTDPTLYNSKWVYEAGLGLFPFTGNTYLSITYNGHITEHFDKVDILYSDVDAYQAFAGKAYGNTLTAALEIPFAQERGNLRLAGTFQVETKGYAFLPSVRWDFNDRLKLTAKGRLFGNAWGEEENIFKTWEDNDSFTLLLSFLF